MKNPKELTVDLEDVFEHVRKSLEAHWKEFNVSETEQQEGFAILAQKKKQHIEEYNR